MDTKILSQINFIATWLPPCILRVISSLHYQYLAAQACKTDINFLNQNNFIKNNEKARKYSFLKKSSIYYADTSLLANIIFLIFYHIYCPAILSSSFFMSRTCNLPEKVNNQLLHTPLKETLSKDCEDSYFSSLQLLYCYKTC